MKKEHLLPEFINKIHQELDRLVSERVCAHHSLYEAARYVLLSEGKRIRPLLTLAIATMLGGSCDKALQAACALEMIHTYSLIHDDLPCMDDDDFRRGKPTLHKIYNEGHAVLVGDFLLTFAFEILAEAPLLSAHQKVRLISILARAAGGEGMIGGQVLDLSQNTSVSLAELHQRKTGALFTAAVQFGGVLADCSSEIFSLLTAFGEKIGFLFQVVDDVLDQEHELTTADAIAAAEPVWEVLKKLPGNKISIEIIIEKILSPLYHPTSSFEEK